MLVSFDLCIENVNIFIDQKFEGKNAEKKYFFSKKKKKKYQTFPTFQVDATFFTFFFAVKQIVDELLGYKTIHFQSMLYHHSS